MHEMIIDGGCAEGSHGSRAEKKGESVMAALVSSPMGGAQFKFVKPRICQWE